MRLTGAAGGAPNAPGREASSVRPDSRATLGRRWSRALYRWLWSLWRPVVFWDHDRLRVERVDGLPIVLLPGVFDGARLRTGALLARMVDADACPPGTRVLDLGTGSGLVAIFAARSGAHVVATDINPEAVRCADVNILAHHFEGRIETRVGDLFQPVQSERFDLILFNPPFFRGEPRDPPDQAWRSPDAFERFLDQLPAHLAPQGRALVVLSTDGDLAGALSAAPHLHVRMVHERELGNEKLTVYELRVAP